MNGEVVPNPARDGRATCTDDQGHDVLCCTFAPNGFGQGYTGERGWAGRRRRRAGTGGPGGEVGRGHPLRAARGRAQCLHTHCSIQREFVWPRHHVTSAGFAATVMLWTMLLANQIRVFTTSGAVAQAGGAGGGMRTRMWHSQPG